ncbi:unnamed protein product [Lymnaea stagnalis]|uniref:Aspartyl/asparaginy/proline hydroxylase domain-containing protein n=1 Tax=Lymnaea stagnalis TaxID=6523 RepID=A0AAV2H5X5_LYMST
MITQDLMILIGGCFISALTFLIILVMLKVLKKETLLGFSIFTQLGDEQKRKPSASLDLNSQSSNGSSVNMRSCLSPECIRCSKNIEVLKTALTRLSYCAENDTSIKNDIENLSLDLRKSLNSLKSSKDVSQKIGTEMKDIKISTPIVFKMSGLREEELWSENEFPALHILDYYFKDIYREFFNLYENHKSPISWKTNTTAAGKWEIAQLIDQGRVSKALDLCPKTSEALKKIPYFMEDNIFGGASFSVVHPGTDIATHCGSSNCRIRCHLGLKVPKNECFLVVGDKTCHWEERKVICFNDAFPHSVHHSGPDDSGIRAVFMFDIWHPDITESQKKLLNFTFST